MKLRLVILSALALAAACKKQESAQPAAGTAAARDTAISVADSFRTPESVLYDSVMDTYIVSNINGAPTGKDDNGFLSRVSPSGRTVELKWVDGASPAVTLNAPKGMAIKGDTLFVADIDEVRLFDRTSGAPLGSRPVRGATFLNDVAVGRDGTLYVTDTGLKPDFSPSGTDAVYRFDEQGRPVAVARGTELGQPNGIWANPNALVVVGWHGDVYYLNTQGQRTPLPKPPHGQLDGVVQQFNGPVIVSSWADSSLQALDPGAAAWRPLLTGLASPADIGYDSRRDRVLIPLFQLNRIEIRPLR
jgi:hypothetical protein